MKGTEQATKGSGKEAGLAFSLALLRALLRQEAREVAAKEQRALLLHYAVRLAHLETRPRQN